MLESLSDEPADLLSVFTNAEYTASASTVSTMYPLPSTHTQRLCGIMLYLVMDQRTLTDELCQTIKALDEVLIYKGIPEYIRRLLLPQVSCLIHYKMSYIVCHRHSVYVRVASRNRSLVHFGDLVILQDLDSHTS